MNPNRQRFQKVESASGGCSWRKKWCGPNCANRITVTEVLSWGWLNRSDCEGALNPEGVTSMQSGSPKKFLSRNSVY